MCGKPATLQCPKCIQLKLTPAHFCSQQCFKGFWSIHKLFHDAPKDTLPPTFKGFKFTGSVRPGLLSPWRVVPDHVEKPDYADDGVPLAEEKHYKNPSITVHTPAQIEGIRVACRLAREVLDVAGAAVKVGITTDEIDRIVHDATIARNAYPAPLNYKGFKKSCCTERGSLPWCA
jgi:methionyl aminopeptidase